MRYAFCVEGMSIRTSENIQFNIDMELVFKRHVSCGSIEPRLTIYGSAQWFCIIIILGNTMRTHSSKEGREDIERSPLISFKQHSLVATLQPAMLVALPSTAYLFSLFQFFVLSFVWHLIRLAFNQRLPVHLQKRRARISHNLVLEMRENVHMRHADNANMKYCLHFRQRMVFLWNWFIRKLFPFCAESLGDCTIFFVLFFRWSSPCCGMVFTVQCSLYVVWLLVFILGRLLCSVSLWKENQKPENTEE